jgi:hypothetical protein
MLVGRPTQDLLVLFFAGATGKPRILHGATGNMAPFGIVWDDFSRNMESF